MANDEMLADVGITGNGPAMLQILQGNYNVPPGTNDYTELLVTEAVLFLARRRATHFKIILPTASQPFEYVKTSIFSKNTSHRTMAAANHRL